MAETIGYDELRADAVLQAAKQMAGAAITAPKSGGQLCIQGGKLFLETVIVHDHETLSRLSAACRCQTRVAVAARKLGLIEADVAVALSLTHKNIGFERTMPSIDYDSLDFVPTDTLPVAAATGVLEGGARHRQQRRRPAGGV